MNGLDVIKKLRAANACYELSKAAGQGLRRVILAAWQVQTCTTSDDISAAVAWLQGLAEQGGQDCPDPTQADVLTLDEVADWEQMAAHLVNLGAGE